MSSERITDAAPTKSEIRAPNRSAESTSRPCSSVPSRYFETPPLIHAGGSIESLSSSVARLNGS